MFYKTAGIGSLCRSQLLAFTLWSKIWALCIPLFYVLFFTWKSQHSWVRAE